MHFCLEFFFLTTICPARRLHRSLQFHYYYVEKKKRSPNRGFLGEGGIVFTWDMYFTIVVSHLNGVQSQCFSSVSGGQLCRFHTQSINESWKKSRCWFKVKRLICNPLLSQAGVWTTVSATSTLTSLKIAAFMGSDGTVSSTMRALKKNWQFSIESYSFEPFLQTFDVWDKMHLAYGSWLMYFNLFSLDTFYSRAVCHQPNKFPRCDLCSPSDCSDGF